MALSASPLRPLILFDGDCTLCNNAVRWINARDRRAKLDFAPRDSAEARAALTSAGLTDAQAAALPDSMILIDERGRIHTRSDAVLRIAARLRFPWPLARAALMLPRILRDPLYNLIARNRHRWFGRSDQSGGLCPLPDAAHASQPDGDRPAHG